jgi:hypothetical protein
MASTRMLNPRYLTYMASYDVASNVCQALRCGGQQKIFVSPLKCDAKSESTDDEPAAARGRREMVLNSSSLLVLGSLFNTVGRCRFSVSIPVLKAPTSMGSALETRKS